MLDILNQECLFLLRLIPKQAFVAEALLAYLSAAGVHQLWEIGDFASMTGDLALNFLSCVCDGVKSQPGAQAREKAGVAGADELEDFHDACFRSEQQF